MSETRKFIIGLVQDYCNRCGYTFESESFSLSFGSHCANLLANNTLSVDSIKALLKKYQSFISGNDLIPEDFSTELIDEISAKLHYVPPKPAFCFAIEAFRKEVEGSLYRAFQVSVTPQEETGRSLLQSYLRPRGFREAQMSGGNCDLIYPTEKTIVETKIWRDRERYLDGITELCGYLDAQDYKEGYYILFDNTLTTNVIVKEKNSKTYDLSSDGHLIHCYFININPIPPSKRRRKAEK